MAVDIHVRHTLINSPVNKWPVAATTRFQIEKRKFEGAMILIWLGTYTIINTAIW